MGHDGMHKSVKCLIIIREMWSRLVLHEKLLFFFFWHNVSRSLET